MNDEQAKQLQRIRERYTAALEIIARRGFAREAPQWAMIGFLLNLVDSQVADYARPVGWQDAMQRADPRRVFITFENRECAEAFIRGLRPAIGSIDAAANMRSACIEKVKELAESWARSVNDQWDDRPDLSFDAAEGLKAAGIVIDALQSVTIQEQEKQP